MDVCALRLSLFSVVRVLSLCLVLQCLWTLVDGGVLRFGSSWEGAATGLDGSRSVALKMHQHMVTFFVLRGLGYRPNSAWSKKKH